MALKKSPKALSKSAVPCFKVAFLHPKYWFIWLVVAIVSLYQYLPISYKKSIASKLGGWQYKKNKKRRDIALANLKLCFPHWQATQYPIFLKKHFIASIYIMLDMPKLWWASKSKIQSSIAVEGLEHIENAKKNNGNVILLTCHSLALDYGVVGLSLNLPVVSMANTMRNELADWLISRGRTRFDVRLTARKDGIRSLVKETKKQQALYYIPDEAHNNQRTIETAFFAHKKKTLSVLAQLKRLTQASIIPCYSYFDFEANQYKVVCLPKMQLEDEHDEVKTTLQMNQQIEQLINIKPEQYMWTMRLFSRYANDKR